ncbi:MAG: hypothetical protein JO127_03725 [Caulobacteraceae bacterium]|nr:hypothetical protein [Caulobacteraceae bacterium]
MDFDLNDELSVLRDALAQTVSRYAAGPRNGATAAPLRFSYNDELDQALEKGEFFSLARQPEYARLGAALLVYEACQAPRTVEVAGSGYVAPLICDDPLPRPIALARAQDLTRMVRFLPLARTVLVDTGDDVLALAVSREEIDRVSSVYAYPMGRYRAPPDLSKARSLGSGAVQPMRTAWRAAMALEAASALERALAATVEYVKERTIFGRALGSFQAVQHRLAEDEQMSQALYWLAMKAAWSGDPADAAAAALYAQNIIPKITFDIHQFNGANGFTLENVLHFWSFRLKYLQSEIGGPASQAIALAELAWPSGAASQSRARSAPTEAVA